jgi:hypothetical protein
MTDWLDTRTISDGDVYDKDEFNGWIGTNLDRLWANPQNAGDMDCFSGTHQKTLIPGGLPWRALRVSSESMPEFAQVSLCYICDGIQFTESGGIGQRFVCSFGTEKKDIGGLVDISSSDSRVTIPVGGDGNYLVFGSASFSEIVIGLADSHTLYMTKNGNYYDSVLGINIAQISSNVRSTGAPSTGDNSERYSHVISIFGGIALSAGDYVEMVADISLSSSGIDFTITPVDFGLIRIS